MANFNSVPQVRFNRSRFDLSHRILTSMNVGDLVPLDWQEIIPGDTFSGKLNGVARVSSAFLKPVMDNLYMDIFHFFIPNRLTYEDSEKVFGNPNPSAYVDNDLQEYPTNKNACSIVAGSVGEYLGLPLGNYPANSISLLPFRAFALVYNQWFRNENVIDEVYVQTGEAVDSETPNANAWSPNNYCGMLPKVRRKKDYFTSCLPKPQKGAEVPITSFGTINANIPVRSVATHSGSTWSESLDQKYGKYGVLPALGLINGSTNINSVFSENLGEISQLPFGASQLNVSNASNETRNGSLYLALANASGNPFLYANGQIDLSDGNAGSINDLRYAFALQKMLERDALYGSRYNEFLLGHFGVTSPDSRLQFTEYLGGGRIPIQIYQSVQTSQGTSNSPLGNVAGFSVSEGYSKFSKGFVEHGIIITCACVRQIHTYQQGVAKKWFKKSRNDFYDPLFATLGEQPVYTSELYYDHESDMKSQIFGYNEAWADYRSLPNIITGEMRSNVENTLDIWHFGDYYNSKPYLSKDFIEETSTFVDRTLAVPSTSQDTFICDFWFDLPAIRVMPTFSVPGLIDHH